jgi:hypothetical protein
MFRNLFLCALLIAAQLTTTPIQTAHAETDAGNAGVVGDGTPASCTATALQTALTGGGLVTFNCGGPATIPISLPLQLTDGGTEIRGGSQITLSGEIKTNLFYVNFASALTLTNLVITNALGVGGDGGAINNNGRLFIDGVTFSHNFVNPQYSGAAIFTSGPAEIRNSNFSYNEAGSAGAIFANTASARVLIHNSRFDNNRGLNTSFGYGGALWVGNGADVTVTDSGFSYNRAMFGGAMYVTQGGKLTMRNTQLFYGLNDNFARVDGGVMYNEGTLIVDGVSFRLNKTPTDGSQSNYGGGIANLGTLTVTNSFFRENESRFGGGVFTGGQITDSRAFIQKSGFSRNRAVMLGGGLYANVFTSTVIIDQTSFNINTANAGGSVARVNANLTLQNSSLTNNTAALGGGGLYVGAANKFGINFT